MRTIHKYVLTEAANLVRTHEGVKWLTAGNQNEHITVRAQVDTSEPGCTRTLHVVGTGHTVPPAASTHIGSALLAGGGFVFHVYSEVSW